MTTITIREDGLDGYHIDLGGIGPREASALRALLDGKFPEDCGPRTAAA